MMRGLAGTVLVVVLNAIGCSDLVVGAGSPSGDAGGNGTDDERAGQAGQLEQAHDPQLPGLSEVALPTACDEPSEPLRAERIGNCEDNGWCWEDGLPSGAAHHLASSPQSADVWLWSARSLRRLNEGEWQPLDLPFTSDLDAAFVFSESSVWVATRAPSTAADELDWYDDVYHYDGKGWQRIGNATHRVHLLHGSGDGTLWAIGSLETKKQVMRWAVDRWLTVPTDPNIGDFDELQPNDSSDAYVKSHSRLLHIVNSTVKELVWSPNNGLFQLARLHDGSLWLTGMTDDAKPLLERVNGDALEPWDVSTLSGVYAIGGSSATDFWLADGHELYHHDGQALGEPVEYGGPFVDEIVARAHDDLYALGLSARQGSILHGDGSAWTEHSPMGPLRSIWGSSNDDVWALGEYGRFHFDGHAWSRESSQDSHFSAVALWGTARDNVYTLRSNGQLERFDGNAWQRVAEAVSSGPFSTNAIGYPEHDSRLSGNSANSLWIAADAVWHYDGEQLVQSSEPIEAQSIRAFGSRDVWTATGKNLFHFDGKSWKPQGIAAAAVWGVGSSDLWIVEPGDIITGNYLSHFDGKAWTRHQRQSGSWDFDLSPQFGDSSTLGGCGKYVWAADNDVVNLFDGQQWTTLLRGGPQIHALWGRSPDALIAGGNTGLIRRAP